MRYLPDGYGKIRASVLVYVLFEMFYLISTVTTSSHKTYSQLGGRSYHLRRKTKEHKHHHKGFINSPTNRGLAERDKLRNDGERSYSLRSTSYAYVLQMELGTPPQKLDFLIDTGSANMAIAGPDCKDEHGTKCKIDTFYYPAKSSTSNRIGHPVETEYGKGSWSGEVYSDVVRLPGGPQIVAEFAVIKQEKEFFLKNSVNEGILGLAYKSLSANQIEPFYDQLVHDTKTPDVFSLSLCNGNGKLWLDYPADDEYHAPIHWTRVIHRAWYTVRVTGIDVAGQSLGLSPYSYPPAIVDSGTTDILLEPEIYIAVIAMLKRNGPAVDERFWNNYCVETDPYKWPYITIYIKEYERRIVCAHHIR